jgi:hypothetical protein
MNFRERRRYWLQAARQMRRLELNYAAKIQALLKEQVSSLILKAEQVGFNAAIGSAPLFNDRFTALLMDMYKKAGLQFAIQTNRYLAKEERKDVFFNAEVLQMIVNILGNQALSLVTRMDDTTKQVLLDIIQQGELEQRSFREIALAMEASWIVQYPRALTIARTEIGRAANIGSMTAAEKQRFQTVKVWVSGQDRLTRTYGKKDEYDHWILDGQRREFLEPFEQAGRTNGITAVAQQPGDPLAPAAFTINCRCVVVFEAKRDANGRLVRK